MSKSRRGAVMMETVIVCVLIAAACLIAVVVLGRSIARGTGIMDRAVSGQGVEAGEWSDKAKQRASEETQEAVKFAGEFSDTKE